MKPILCLLMLLALNSSVAAEQISVVQSTSGEVRYFRGGHIRFAANWNPDTELWDTVYIVGRQPKADTIGYYLAICGDTTYHQDTVSVRLLVEALYQDHTPDCEKRWPKVWPDTVHKQTVEEK